MTRQEQGIYIGTMSGTSMDGLDLIAVDFNQSQVHLLFSKTIPYPDKLRDELTGIALNPDATINQMCKLDTLLGQFYAATINTFIDTNNINRKDIVAIGSHGQTIRHNIDHDSPYTLQIGDPNIIAAKTGVTVVADFRRRDVALGGQGAPFATAFHNQVFRSDKINRAIINIGGIANITFLPADNNKPVCGFDTGPGNTFLDAISSQFFQEKFDSNGKHARSGKIHTEILKTMLEIEPYFKQNIPKTTGTDYFSPDWLERFQIKDIPPQDIMATLVELTVLNLCNGIQSLPEQIDECYICGGGAHNSYLLERLKHHLQSSSIETTESLGVHPDWVEALAFAWLAQQTMQKKPGNLPSVTNAEKFTILGAVYF